MYIMSVSMIAAEILDTARPRRSRVEAVGRAVHTDKMTLTRVAVEAVRCGGDDVAVRDAGPLPPSLDTSSLRQRDRGLM